MKPRKKQRIDNESQPEKTLIKKNKPREVVQEGPEESFEDEDLEEVIEAEDGEGDLEGKFFITANNNESRRNGLRRCCRLRRRRTGRLPRRQI